jgi:uncharacterized protein (UPF0548 family)
VKPSGLSDPAPLPGSGMLDIGGMATKRKVGRPSEGRERFIVSFDPKQLVELRREAFRRAAAEGSARPDVSALVRDAVADWLARRKK